MPCVGFLRIASQAKCIFHQKKYFPKLREIDKYLSLHSVLRLTSLTDGVTGNTSDFGSEESRFETWSVNNHYAPNNSGLSY